MAGLRQLVHAGDSVLENNLKGCYQWQKKNYESSSLEIMNLRAKLRQESEIMNCNIFYLGYPENVLRCTLIS